VGATICDELKTSAEIPQWPISMDERSDLHLVTGFRKHLLDLANLRFIWDRMRLVRGRISVVRDPLSCDYISQVEQVSQSFHDHRLI
jgi:hypothetical protein